MCVGGGAQKTAEQYYEEMKKDPDALPSLRMSKGELRNLKLGNVPKPVGGGQRSSLLTALKSSY